MSTADPSALAPGRWLGPYRLLRKIGLGGSAWVYAAEARSAPSAAPVALKVMDASGVSGTELARFEREHEALAELEHPNVVRVFGAGQDGTFAWLAMELVDGFDLEELLARWRVHPTPDRFEVAERVLRGIGSALQAVHARGLIHRDVKPANILVARDGTPKLTDFGIARTGDAAAADMGRIVGTIAYLAPETLADEPIDARADLYGLGAVLYTILALRRPIEADSVAAYLARHLSDPPPPPRAVDPAVPAPLEQVCLRLLAKRRELRFAHVQAMFDALEHPAPGPWLYGRDEEAAQWIEQLARLGRGRGGVVWVSGRAGSGRTSFLQRVERLAAEAGRRVAWIQDAVVDAEVVLADDLGSLAMPARMRWDELVRGVRRGTPRLLVAVGEPPTVRTGPRTDEDAVITLQPFDRGSIEGVLRDQGLRADVVAALAPRLLELGVAWPREVLDHVSALEREGMLVDGPEGREARSLTELTEEDLPPPERVRVDVVRRLGRLDADGRELVELLAVLGRPAGAGLIAHAMSRPGRVPMVLDGLVQGGMLVTEPGQEDHALRFQQPGVAVAVRSAMAPALRAERHLAVAQALQRQRWREPPTFEVARHLAAAGRLAEAVPLYLRYANASLQQGRMAEAVRAADAALGLCRQSTQPGEAMCADAQRVKGAALVALGRWREAAQVLGDVVAVSRGRVTPEELGGILLGLGRALHHLGRLEEAAPVLMEAASLEDAGPPVHERAWGVLADIELHQGHLPEAERLLRAALHTAQARGAREAEARARRGLANVHALQGDLQASAEELADADDLLVPDGDPNVRAGVLARTIDLELVAGRLAVALQKADVLLDLCRSRGLTRRLPEAFALAAACRFAVGQQESAVELARAALADPEMGARGEALARLLAVRVLLDARAWRLGDQLPRVGGALHGLHDAEGQLLALRARASSRVDMDQAVHLAALAVDRPPAPLHLARINVCLDAARASLEAGAAAEVGRMLDEVEAGLTPGQAAGVRLEVALLRAHAGGNRAPALQLVRDMAVALPPRLREGFLGRPDVEALLR